MKKVISTILALVMVLAVVATVPMTIGAAEATLNTSRYFPTDTTTGLSASYGTPAIVDQMGDEWGDVNGKIDTLKDSAWTNAYRFTVTASMTQHINNNISYVPGWSAKASSDYDVYILWDENNLYILQDTRALYTTTDDFTLNDFVNDTDALIIPGGTAKRELGVWSDSSTIQEEHSYYQILLPRDMTDLGNDANEPKAYAVGAIPCLNDETVANLAIYECASLGRDFDYESTTENTKSKTRLNHATLFSAGVRSFVERLDTGYRTSVVIPWSFLDSTPDDAFANLAKDNRIGQQIGFGIFNMGAKHLNDKDREIDGTTFNPDTAAFDTLTLKAEYPYRVDGVYTAPLLYSSIEHLLDVSSNTGFDAVKATTAPTLDGKMDAAYSNAIKYDYKSGKGTYYLMWDNQYLYVYEIVYNKTIANMDLSDATNGAKNNNTTGVQGWGSWTGTDFNIILPSDNGALVAGTDSKYNTNNAGASRADLTDGFTRSYSLGVLPGVKQSDPVGTTAAGVVRARKMDYAYLYAWNGTNQYNKHYMAYDSSIVTWSMKTEGGYTTETAIPWTYLNWDPNSAFADNSKDKLGQTIGVKINQDGSGCHINHTPAEQTIGGKTYKWNGDFCGFDPVTLLPGHTETIAPDYDHWLGTDGQFIKNSPVTKDSEGKATGATTATYYINDAGDLLALAHLLESEAFDGGKLSTFGLVNKSDKAYLSKNKTFKLTTDIDFNPGVDWARANDYLINKNHGKGYDITNYSAKLPTNVFVGFDRFYGVLDGQGYAIKGLYNPDALAVSWRSNGITNATGGLIGQLSQGGIIDLKVESGYVGTSMLKDNVMFGGLIGEIRPETYTDFTNGEIILSNIYVGADFTADRYGTATATDTNGYAYGGVASSIWAATKEAVPQAVSIKATFADIVFSGNLIDNPNNVKGAIKDGKYNVYAEDVVLSNNFKASGSGTWGANNVTFNYTYGSVIANISANAHADAITGTRYTKVINGAGVPDGKEGALVELTDGTVAPIKVADMFTSINMQASKADANGKYSIRLIGEIQSLEYKSVGFMVTLKGTKDGVSKTYSVDLSNNSNVYTSIQVGESEIVTPDGVDFGMVDGEYMFATVLANLSTSVAYELSVQAVYTLNDGTVVTGIAQTTDAVGAWN